MFNSLRNGVRNFVSGMSNLNKKIDNNVPFAKGIAPCAYTFGYHATPGAVLHAALHGGIFPQVGTPQGFFSIGNLERTVEVMAFYEFAKTPAARIAGGVIGGATVFLATAAIEAAARYGINKYSQHQGRKEQKEGFAQIKDLEAVISESEVEGDYSFVELLEQQEQEQEIGQGAAIE